MRYIICPCCENKIAIPDDNSDDAVVFFDIENKLANTFGIELSSMTKGGDEKNG